jgi:ABC-type branched-subunit amino acid transport system substrate-binding protein
MLRHKLAATVAVLGLVAAACGNRAGSSAEPTTTTKVGETTTTTAKVPMVGTLVSPCGPGAGGDKITIAVIGDIAGPAPGLGQPLWDAMDAFRDYCNGLGGIDGRELALMKLDSQLFQHQAATQQACDGALALVGSGAPFDDGGAQTGVDCGIPDIPAYATHPAHALATNVIEPLPNPTYKFSTAPGKYLAKTYPDAVKKAALVWPNVATTEIQAKRTMEALTPVGWNFTYTGQTNVVESDYSTAAKAVKDSGAQYLNFISSGPNVALLAQALREQDYFPQVMEVNQSAYNPQFIQAGGQAVEGIHVLATTWPFEEADQSPALQVYLAALQKVHPGAQPDALGVQAFSAGLLFATAAKAAGANLTRETLMAQLKQIHSWDAGGMHGVSDPGNDVPSQCFAYLIVKGGKFVREFPAKGFECDKTSVVDLHGDYGTGAK